MEEYVEEKGVSLSDIFRTIFSQKWLALILAVAITVVGTLAMYFYGKTKTVYSATFVLQFPGSEESPTSYTYPDGTHFHFSDIISEDNLTAAKSSDSAFSSVDVKEMRKNGDITIKRELIETATGSNNYIANYTLSVKANYFNSGDSARDFIVELIANPRKYLAGMNIDYGSKLTAASNALTYDDQLNFLQAQVDELRAGYNNFVGAYGGSFVVGNGKTLNECLSNIDLFLKNNNISNLKAEVLLNHYIKSEEALNKYKNDRELKMRELKIKQFTLDSIKGLVGITPDTDPGTSSGVLMGISEYIALSNEVGQLKQDLEDLDNFINSGVTSGESFDAFASKINTLEAGIKQLTDEYKTVADIVYSKATTVSYENANIVEAEGGFGLVMSALICLVIGIVVAFIVAYIVGYNKSKKAATSPVREVRAYTAPAPQETPLQLQAAVTTDEAEEEEKQDK